MADDLTNKPTRLAKHIGKYEILSHVATGGMGVVYKARDTDLDRLVALKILPADLAKNQMTLERFKREAAAAAQLRHENIVATFDVGEANGANYIAFEFVEGTDLQDYINRECKLDAKDARLIMIQAAQALVHAHEQHVVHRDIKPSNFLLTLKDGRLIVKLSDFGLAIRQEDSAEFRLTKDKSTVGTVDYMSPEQATDSRAVDIRSDIYSLGCTFFHMLAGEAPFSKGSLPERIVQHMQQAPPDLRALNKKVPKSFVAIINRMLEKKPADRYQTPTELLHDLEHPDRVIGSKPAMGKLERHDKKTSGAATDEFDKMQPSVRKAESADSVPLKKVQPGHVKVEPYDEPADSMPLKKAQPGRVKVEPYYEPADSTPHKKVQPGHVKVEPYDEDEPADSMPLKKAQPSVPRAERKESAPRKDEPLDLVEPSSSADSVELVPLKVQPSVEKAAPTFEPADLAPFKMTAEPPRPRRRTDPAMKVHVQPAAATRMPVDTDEVDTPTLEKPRRKSASSGSPWWMYAAGGSAVLMGVILVFAIATGNRPSSNAKKKDPPPIVVQPRPIDPTPIEVADTAGDKMGAPAPELPLLDPAFAKVDRRELRKEYVGKFGTFPGVPEGSKTLRVSRLAPTGPGSCRTLAEALAQTQPDQWALIEIADNGPIYVSALPSLTSRLIVLRGAEGFHPLLAWETPKKPADPKTPRTLLSIAQGSLILDNLDIVLRGTDDAPATLFDLGASDFFCRNCSFSLVGRAQHEITVIRRLGVLDNAGQGAAPANLAQALLRAWPRNLAAQRERGFHRPARRGIAHRRPAATVDPGARQRRRCIRPLLRSLHAGDVASAAALAGAGRETRQPEDLGASPRFHPQPRRLRQGAIGRHGSPDRRCWLARCELARHQQHLRRLEAAAGVGPEEYRQQRTRSLAAAVGLQRPGPLAGRYLA